MKLLIVIAAIAAIITTPIPSLAEDVPATDQPCEGPAELCEQVRQLRRELVRKEVQDRVEKKVEITEAVVEEAKDTEQEAMGAIALAGATAVILKILLSVITAWKSYFKSDKGKAWLKIVTLAIGFLLFIVTNLGFGMTWWQSLILAGGGPGSILVNEFTKMLPVVLGKRKYDDAEALEGALSGHGALPGGPSRNPDTRE